MPSVPFLSDERNVLIIPALTLLSSLLNASARSASRASWLMKTNGLDALEGRSSASGEILDLSAFVIVSPYVQGAANLPSGTAALPCAESDWLPVRASLPEAANDSFLIDIWATRMS